MGVTLQVSVVLMMSSRDPAVRAAVIEAQNVGMVVDTLLGKEGSINAGLMSAAIAEVLDIAPHEAAVRLLGTAGMGVDSLFTALDELGVANGTFAKAFEEQVARFNESVDELGSMVLPLTERLKMVASAVKATRQDQPDGL
jgi:hypothetical protein